MESYAIRVTMSFAEVKPVVALWALECNKLLAYEHHESGKKTHCHFLIEGARQCRKTFYNIFDRKFPGLSGQQHRAGKNYDGDDTYITYMSKGGTDSSLVYNKGYLPEYLEEKTKAWQKTEQYVKVSKQVTQYQNYMDDMLIEQAFAQWKQDNPNWQTEFLEVKSAKYKFLTGWCMSAAVEHHSGIITQQTWCTYHMLMHTYCYKHSIPNISFKKRMER